MLFITMKVYQWLISRLKYEIIGWDAEHQGLHGKVLSFAEGDKWVCFVKNAA